MQQIFSAAGLKNVGYSHVAVEPSAQNGIGKRKPISEKVLFTDCIRYTHEGFVPQLIATTLVAPLSGQCFIHGLYEWMCPRC